MTVTVTNNGLSGSLAGGFTYVAAPTVSGVSPNSGIDGGWDGGDDHGDELRRGGDGDVRRDGGDERGGRERDTDHGDDAGGSAGAVTVTVTVNGQSGSLANGYTYVAAPTVSSVARIAGRRRAGRR